MQSHLFLNYFQTGNTIDSDKRETIVVNKECCRIRNIPDLSFSDFWLFLPLKIHYDRERTDEVIAALEEYFNCRICASNLIYQSERYWNKFIETQEDYVEPVILKPFFFASPVSSVVVSNTV